MPDNMQVPVNVPVPLVPRLTLPPGVIAVPGELSVTVAVHNVVCPMVTVDCVQLTLVVVVRLVTVTLACPELIEWFVSPP